MAFFRKAGSILGRNVSNCISSQDVTVTKASIFQAVRWMSSSKVFVGGISYSTDDMSLREAFSKHGEVAEARVILDRETGRSRGFGFVTFASSEEASAAIQALDQQELHGRRIRVAYANDRTHGYGGGGGYNRGYGNDGGNYGGGGGGYGGNYGGGGGGYGGNYGGGGGGYGGDYNSAGGGGGYNESGSYGGGSNYNSGVSDYGSAGGTSAGYDHQSFGAAGSHGSFGGSSAVENDNFGRSSAGDDESDNSDKGVGGGEGFGEDDGNKFKEGDDADNYADRRS